MSAVMCDQTFACTVGFCLLRSVRPAVAGDELRWHCARQRYNSPCKLHFALL